MKQTISHANNFLIQYKCRARNNVVNDNCLCIVDSQRAIAHADTKKELQTDLTDLIKDKAAVKEIELSCKEYMKKTNLGEHEVVVLVWKCLMASVDWNKKEELVADQAINHLKVREHKIFFSWCTQVVLMWASYVPHVGQGCHISRTAGNTGNYREILGNTGKYWEI